MVKSEDESVLKNLESPPPPLEFPSSPAPSSPCVSETPPTPSIGIDSNFSVNVGALGISSSASANTIFEFWTYVVGNPSMIAPYPILRVSGSNNPTCSLNDPNIPSKKSISILNTGEGTFEDRSMRPNVELA